MNGMDDILNELSELFTEENSMIEIKENFREDNVIGSLIISEYVYRFSCNGDNYVVFDNRDQAERIATHAIENRLMNNDRSLDNDILAKHLKMNNPDSFAYKEAKKKYDYMSADDLARDYRSGLSRSKPATEQKIFEGRNIAISSYSREIASDLTSNPMDYFQENEGLHSVFSVIERYSSVSLNYQSAAIELVGRHSWGDYLTLNEDKMLFTGSGRIVVREYL